MRQYEHLQWGADRLRIGPWRSDPTAAELSSVVSARPLARATVERGLEAIAARGYRRVVTNALTHPEQIAYLDAGFRVHERLRLLAHDLRHVPPAPRRPRLRRGHRHDHARILMVDAEAFEPFWQLDRLAFLDAIHATPSCRLRVDAGAGVAGYAVTGRAGSRGYLQRLAVRPADQGGGLGSALVIDALRWLRRRGCDIAMVNTQEVNAGAFRLYEKLGFTARADGLAVLTYEFPE